MTLFNEYNTSNTRNTRNTRKTRKQIANTYFIITALMISGLTISALSILNYSVNQEHKIEIDSLNNDNSYNNPDTFDKLQQQNNSCAYCKDLVHIINLEFEKYNKTIEDIVDIIKNICSLIHAPIVSQECIFISNNIEKILNWTSSGMNSTVICDKLHLCNNLPMVVSR
jgi:hypothetical protein